MELDLREISVVLKMGETSAWREGCSREDQRTGSRTEVVGELAYNGNASCRDRRERRSGLVQRQVCVRVWRGCAEGVLPDDFYFSGK